MNAYLTKPIVIDTVTKAILENLKIKEKGIVKQNVKKWISGTIICGKNRGCY